MADFELSIGSSAGATDILAWTSVGTSPSYLSPSTAQALGMGIGSTYYVNVRAVDSSGTRSSVVSSSGFKILSAVTVSARYAIAPNWNDYAVTATPTSACTGAELGYFACLHGGEMKRVDLAAAPSCAGYAVADELEAFEWACDDSGGAGNVYFHSRQLKKSRALADLLTSSTWKTNRVVISQAGAPIAASVRSAWWTNPVQPLPDNSASGLMESLASAGTIYTLASSRDTAGYQIDADKIGVAIFPGATLSLVNPAAPTCGGGNCAVYSILRYFLWFEGELSNRAASGSSGFSAKIRHSVVRRASFSGFGTGFGDSSIAISSNLLSQITASNNTADGLVLKGSRNVFTDIISTNNGGRGISTGDVSSNNLLQNVTVANNSGSGIHVISHDNTFLGITAINNGNHGFYLSGYRNTVSHALFHNNSSYSLYMVTYTDNTLSQLAGSRLFLSSASTNMFTGNLRMESADCSVFGGTNPGLVHGTCANQGFSDATLSLVAGSPELVGQITSDDTRNASDNNGAMSFASITDWVNFENLFRGWGRSGTFPGFDTRGACTSGTCQIWDFRLKTTDTFARNVTGDGVNPNADFLSGQNCPAHLAGNVTVTDRRTAPRTFLRNALEILGDTIGNEDGVCESNESCLYAPNFGAYQGEGDYTTNECVFQAGTLSGIRLYGYPTNGVP
ncbi:MAG: right-handed parallel beta-helix repeat-containing protein [Oligoflexia bacterium]|nr:right-handed parallel beta-helix repeat-containing protein [Oligoflexia bacterium]